MSCINFLTRVKIFNRIFWEWGLLMSYIFDVYGNGVSGIIEVSAKDSEDAIKKVNNLGLKFSSMRDKISIYKIQYSMVNTKQWKL